ncbi:MAG: zinc finger Ran-binding domain-containing protein [Candidatus Kariarchaeaceae archaeon]|jgi:hypothetical protein
MNCPTCGTKNDPTQRSCVQCDTSLEQQSEKRFIGTKTPWFRAVVAIAWLGNLFLIIFSVIIALTNPFLGIIITVMTGIMIYVVKAMGEVDDNARLIYLTLAIIALITSAFMLFYPGLALFGFIVYTLGYQKDTVKLFRASRRSKSYNLY